MASNSNSSSGNLTSAQIASLSSVPPVPQAILDAVATTPYGIRNPSWNTESCDVPQMITALVLIEQSSAGKAWGVQLAEIPRGTRPSDARFYKGCGLQALVDAEACIEWFFKRSKLSETAPMATITWSAPEFLENSTCSGIGFSCNAILRMLHAAQVYQEPRDIKLERFEAMEKKIAELETHIATLNVELKQATLGHKVRAPTVTCLMHLFAGYAGFTCSTCNPGLTTDIDTDSSTPKDAGGSGTATIRGTGEGAHKSSSNTPIRFSIAPHTDRLSDLSLDAQNWFLEQLNTRTVWVRATDPESDDNHISWTPFKGAVEMSKSVAFSHGNYRFW